MQGKTKKKGWIGSLLLFVTALIWGSSFVAQSLGMDKIGAFTFNGIRTLIGGLFLAVVILFRCVFGKQKPAKLCDKKTLGRGAALGAVFFFASNLQQLAFYQSTAGKIAFITALYIFFVPLFGLFLKKKVPALTWCCVAAGFVGLYFLCIGEQGISGLNGGDALAFGCAVFFAVHILMIDRFVKTSDGMVLSCVQFLVSGTASVICMFLFETPNLQDIFAAANPILYAGFLSCGVAYTLQILGQKTTEPAVASLILCMESVFAVLTAAVILKEYLTARELLGCGIMFAAILVSELSSGSNGKEGREKPS